MKNITEYFDKKDIKEKIPYYPHTLYITPIILAALVALLYFLFKNITMGKLQNIMEQLKNIERKLLKKESEVKVENESQENQE